MTRFIYHHENTTKKYYDAAVSTISLANTFLQTEKGSLLFQFFCNFKKDEADESEKEKGQSEEAEEEYIEHDDTHDYIHCKENA